MTETRDTQELERPLRRFGRLRAVAETEPVPVKAKRSMSASYVRRALTADLTMLVIAGTLTIFVSPTAAPTGVVPQQPLGWAIAFPFIVAALFYLRGMYKPPL